MRTVPAVIRQKKLGLTQAEVAEAAAIADRTYADIERGTVNMRIETFLRICEVLHLTPNDILIEEEGTFCADREALFERLDECGKSQQHTALRLLGIYLDSL